MEKVCKHFVIGIKKVPIITRGMFDRKKDREKVLNEDLPQLRSSTKTSTPNEDHN